VFDATQAPPHRRFCTFTSALVLSDGRIVVAFRAGSSKDSADENIIIRLSADQGKTWETVCEGIETEIDGVAGCWRSAGLTELEPGRLIAEWCWFDRSEPDRPLSNPETQGTLPARVFVMESLDDGRTWINQREVQTAPFEGIATTGSILKLTNGSLAVQYEAWKAYDDPSPGEHHAILRISHDGGYTFEPATVVAHDPEARVFYWDQRLDVAPDSGALIGLFWSHDRNLQQDINVHVACGTPDGATWTAPADAGFAGQIARPLCLGDEQVLAAYVHRHDPPSLRAILSRDFGKTWDVEHELTFYESGSGKEAGMGGKRDFGDYWGDMNRWSFGHADPALLPNGDIFIAFYGGDSSAMSMHWVRIAR
jgi:hypothetical protein